VGDAHQGGRSGHGVFFHFPDFEQRKYNQIGIFDTPGKPPKRAPIYYLDLPTSRLQTATLEGCRIPQEDGGLTDIHPASGKVSIPLKYSLHHLGRISVMQPTRRICPICSMWASFRRSRRQLVRFTDWLDTRRAQRSNLWISESANFLIIRISPRSFART